MTRIDIKVGLKQIGQAGLRPKPNSVSAFFFEMGPILSLAQTNNLDRPILFTHAFTGSELNNEQYEVN